MSAVSSTVAKFVAETLPTQIPRMVRKHAVDTIVDGYATALAGQHEPGPQTIVGALLPQAGIGSARALGVSDRLVDPASAALFNATASHALDYDAISFAVSGFVGSPALFALALFTLLGAAALAIVNALRWRNPRIVALALAIPVVTYIGLSLVTVGLLKYAISRGRSGSRTSNTRRPDRIMLQARMPGSTSRGTAQ